MFYFSKQLKINTLIVISNLTFDLYLQLSEGREEASSVGFNGSILFADTKLNCKPVQLGERRGERGEGREEREERRGEREEGREERGERRGERGERRGEREEGRGERGERRGERGEEKEEGGERRGEREEGERRGVGEGGD